MLCGETATAAAVEDGPGESQLEPDIDVVGVLMDARSEASADGSNRSHRVGESQDEGEGEDGDEVSEQKSEAENKGEGEIGDEKIDNDGIPGEIGDDVSEKRSESARTPRPAVDDKELDFF